jgi:hypothetical protein
MPTEQQIQVKWHLRSGGPGNNQLHFVTVPDGQYLGMVETHNCPSPEVALVMAQQFLGWAQQQVAAGPGIIPAGPGALTALDTMRKRVNGSN